MTTDFTDNSAGLRPEPIAEYHP